MVEKIYPTTQPDAPNHDHVTDFRLNFKTITVLVI